MKAISALLVTLLLSIPALAEMRMGTYKLTGAIPGGNAYSGTVKIEPNGENYKLHWVIGDQGQQQQMGQGILNGDVLSVAYFDLSGQDYGVVSFKIVSDSRIEGKWASFESNVQGSETLEFSER